MTKYQVPKGLFDITPDVSKEDDLWRRSDLWAWVEAEIRAVTHAYGFRELRTPIFERTELFQRGVGESSDIVSKEMYSFLDKGERSMTLRPEGTASAMRAFMEHRLDSERPIQKLFYIGPMFRYERPQAGRYRQHHQFGVEAVGSQNPLQDVECIDLLMTLLSRLGINKTTVHINSLGDSASRQAFREGLRDYLRPHFAQLSQDSQTRFEKNPLRILDSKVPGDQELCKNAPKLTDYLQEEALEHFTSVQRLLRAAGIPFEVNTNLVRGLDYYNRTVFEIVSGELGAQNSLAGGGRYDGLLKSLGGADLPAFGFGCGLERLIQSALRMSDKVPKHPRPDLILIPMSENEAEICQGLAQQLRQQGFSIELYVGGKKLKQAMKYANTVQARFCVVLGEHEAASSEIDLKNMDSGQTECHCSIANLPAELALRRSPV